MAAVKMLGQFLDEVGPGRDSLEDLRQAAIDALLATLKDADGDVRRSAAEAIGRSATAGAKAIAALSLAAEDQDAEVRHAAVRSIGRLAEHSPTDAAGALQDIINQPARRPDDVAMAAVDALQRCGTDAAAVAVGPLARIVGDQRLDDRLRLKAADTLRWLGPEARCVVDELVAVATGEADTGLRTAAAAAIVAAEVDPTDVASHVSEPATRERLLDGLRRVGPQATSFRHALQGIWDRKPAPPKQDVAAAATEPSVDEAPPSADPAAGVDPGRIAALEEGQAEIMRFLQSQQRERTAEKEWYSIKEAAELSGYAEWTIRQACNTERIDAQKGDDNRWRISREEVRRIQAEGLPAG
jgi:hypothetical protein